MSSSLQHSENSDVSPSLVLKSKTPSFRPAFWWAGLRRYQMQIGLTQKFCVGSAAGWQRNEVGQASSVSQRI